MIGHIASIAQHEGETQDSISDTPDLNITELPQSTLDSPSRDLSAVSSRSNTPDTLQELTHDILAPLVTTRSGRRRRSETTKIEGIVMAVGSQGYSKITLYTVIRRCT
jgi:hypothetical protein